MQRQLDIFDDSRDVALRSELAQALIEHQNWRQTLAANAPLDVATVLDTCHRLDGAVVEAGVASCLLPPRKLFLAATTSRSVATSKTGPTA